ncbi:MAG: hypothetical protein WC029_14455 [Sulfuricella sp.]
MQRTAFCFGVASPACGGGILLCPSQMHAFMTTSAAKGAVRDVSQLKR